MRTNPANPVLGEKTLAWIDEEFPSLRSITHLDNSSVGVPPMSAMNAMERYFKGRIWGTTSFHEIVEMFEDVRYLLSELLGGTPSNYALQTSTTDAINAAAHSIPYPPGSNVVICDLEFPANYIPWFNLKSFNDVDVRVVKSRDGMVSLDDFNEAIDNNTRVVSVSHVQFSNGFKIDAKALAKLAHDHDAFVMLDIIQSAGVINFDLEALGVDFAAGQATKYLIGPIGAGYLYVRDAMFDRVKPRYMGWWGVQDMENFEFGERIPYKDARMFQVGSSPIICYQGLRESLKCLLSIPGEARERASMLVANEIRELLEANGISHGNLSPRCRSHVVSIVVPDVDAMHKQLLKQRIYTSVRGGNIRASTHFYNSIGDAKTLVKSIEGF
ncbi:aminotransferase class V-fold PLP-dependent enzyme [Candidatus Bathyarchaeota archaeon]|nr:aminotransferase class V-fold PLP-dependent enzyme [Candidatus Bathyarchaeota archaeon]